MTHDPAVRARNGRLVIVRGLPGSGKSTYARYLVGIGVCDVHLESDAYFMVDGVYLFDPARLSDNHARCLRETEETLGSGKSVVVSNTFTTRAEVKPYVYLGFPCRIVAMTGNYGSVHNVPEATIGAMRERWESVSGEAVLP